jgi:glucosamine kinase
MILIADSGSTKTNWCFISDKMERIYFQTEGYNPYFVSADYISNSLQKNFPESIKNEKIEEIFFYGAGCGSGRDNIISTAVQNIFPKANIFIEMDMLAAARGLLGMNSGFAAILGTGTNTCMYDGNRIVKNIDSLGFILGDEGSGGAIGKKLLSDYLRNNMPSDVYVLFFSEYNLAPEEIMHQYIQGLWPTATVPAFVSLSVITLKMFTCNLLW